MFFRCAALVVGLLGSLPSSAEPKLLINGFASVGAGWTDEDVTYHYGSSQRAEWANFSKVGLNLTFPFSNQTSFAGQFVASGQSREFEMRADWLFFKAQFLESFQVRIGRHRIPTWMLSEVIDVGYTYPWVVPPAAVYSTNPVKSFNGVSLIFRRPVNDIDFTLEPFGGALHEDFVTRGTNREKFTTRIETLRLYGAQVSANYMDNLLLRGSYVHTKLNILAKDLTYEGLISDTWSVGLKLDWHAVLLMSEFARATQSYDQNSKELIATMEDMQADVNVDPEALESVQSKLNAANARVSDSKSYYVTLGYRWRSILPHVSYTNLIAPTNNLIGTTQESYIYGVRWYADHGVSAKAEVEKVRAKDGLNGLAYETVSVSDYNVFRMAIDAVF